jgi:hypothetical protein
MVAATMTAAEMALARDRGALAARRRPGRSVADGRAR